MSTRYPRGEPQCPIATRPLNNSQLIVLLLTPCFKIGSPFNALFAITTRPMDLTKEAFEEAKQRGELRYGNPLTDDCC